MPAAMPLTGLWCMQEHADSFSTNVTPQYLEGHITPGSHAAAAVAALTYTAELRQPIADVAMSGLVRLAQGDESEARNSAARALAQLMCDARLKESIMATATPDVADMLQEIFEASQAYFRTNSPSL